MTEWSDLSRLLLYQGRKILDAASTMFNVTLGYSCEPVKRAMHEQIDALAYGNIHKGVANPSALKLSELLTELLEPEGRHEGTHWQSVDYRTSGRV